MKPLTKKIRQGIAVLALLLLWTPVQAGSLLTIGAGASVTGGTGTNVCADAHDFTGTFDGIWCGGPLLVELLFFQAQGFEDYVKLTWGTASELDCAGFHLLRRSGSGNYTRLTQSLIPAEGSPAWGATYVFEDRNAVPGTTYAYKLEDVDSAGFGTLHGAASAWAGRVNITANGLDESVSLAQGEPVSIQVEIRDGKNPDIPMECWIAAHTPFSWYSCPGDHWVPGILPVNDFPGTPGPYQVLYMALPEGVYTFYLALDGQVNGKPDIDRLDQVRVVVR